MEPESLRSSSVTGIQTRKRSSHVDICLWILPTRLPADEPAKKELFEFLQCQAEAALEKLHECAEGEVQANLMEKISATDIVGYADFQRKLVHLTSVTRNHFEKLVTALQNDLSDCSDSPVALVACADVNV
ncbi:hypothetical protein RJ640_027531 [Escallonia rubra]|uniref:Uncharacterized protein n=1 Tax=Escallonia rubra TaxID=112253 RepID=A0AA88QVV6_9ASTE|nr:hypothetical protein RJ640_027531 [Escallonia rubra]